MNARQEWLLSRWEAACQDPELAKLPHKIELNEWGKIELTPPAPPIHGSFAFRVARLLDASLGGEASVECPVLTDIGVRVPDAVWVPEQRRQEVRGRQPLQAAPEICVEVLSSSNTLEELTEKTRAYLLAGAREVIWVDPDAQSVRFFGANGETTTSQFAVRFDSLFTS
jgi:Uma2 family endonuclease